MMKCTKDCVEQFVDYINYTAGWRIDELEDHAVAHALCSILEEIEKCPPLLWYDPSRKHREFFDADGAWDEPCFKLSDFSGCKYDVTRLFDFTQSVCQLIKYDNLCDVYFNLIALFGEWYKAIRKEWAEPPPTECEQEDGDVFEF